MCSPQAEIDGRRRISKRGGGGIGSRRRRYWQPTAVVLAAGGSGLHGRQRSSAQLATGIGGGYATRCRGLHGDVGFIPRRTDAANRQE
jgi:hypothetical protein